jgi:SAM-dependent methyltransferase
VSGSLAAERWRLSLDARHIPDPIIAAAPQPPWGFPADLFRVRATKAVDGPPNPTTLRALESLPDGGRVLDVGCGGGATSVPLAARAATITGVDGQADMLAAFAEAIRRAGGEPVTVEGPWPASAAAAGTADVVVCGHVLYNVPDLVPFVRGLDAAATRRVVLEITERHPLAWMHDLWQRFHGISFPDGPTADDAEAVIAEVGIDVRREGRPADDAKRGGFDRREDAVALVRRRLCLGAHRDAEVAEALGDRLRAHEGLWSVGPAGGTPVSTLWWDRG